ncbi:M48 family metallopeptidase [Pseudomonadota bacterium]
MNKARTKSKHVLTINEQKIPFTLVASNLARHVSFKVGVSSGLEIIVPRRFNREKLPDIVREKKEWILKNMKKAAMKKAQGPQFKTDTTFSVLGEEKLLHLVQRKGERSKVVERGEDVYVHCNGILSDAKKTLENHLRKKAKQYFVERTEELAVQMGTTYSRITVRGQKSRWGSCAANRNLNFNWRLILTSPRTIDSIIIHELAHTVHMNHSASFYKLVEKHCPSHKKLSRDLKEKSFIL